MYIKAMKRILSIFFILYIISVRLFAQETIVKGKITDKESGEALPYTTIMFKGTTIGTVSDSMGRYLIRTRDPVDSIIVSYVGYADQTRRVIRGITQVINLQMGFEEEVIEVTVKRRENPAWAIMRNVIKNKEKNDRRGLTAYEYELYNRLEISVDNISEKLKKRKIMQQMPKDSINSLPIYLSETISKNYYTKNPEHTKVVIEATKITGVGVTDGSTVAQFLGAGYQEYNFYKNWVSVTTKDFVSPLADSWNGYYEYDLQDSVLDEQNRWVYRIDIKPKRKQDLAFSGTIWIQDSTFALTKIQAEITKGANINYIEGISIMQELQPTPAGPWLPLVVDLVIDLAELREKAPGMLMKSHTSFKKVVVNKPRPASFFDKLVKVNEDATIKDKLDKDYWAKNRHDSISGSDKRAYAMIDSLKDVPIVKTYVEVINIIFNGYKKAGPVDIGPYLGLYANNKIEGHRFSIGVRTNISFSRKWIFAASGAYGTQDKRFKYRGTAEYIFSRNRWTSISLERKEDIDRLGLSIEALEASGNTMFSTFARWGNMNGAYYTTENTLKFQTEPFKDFTQKIILKNKNFDPTFPFAYYHNPETPDSTLHDQVTTTEIVLESRYARDEYFVQNDNSRISIGTEKAPIYTLRYTMGVKGIMNSHFNYHKLSVDISHIIKWGALGRTYYSINAGHVFSRLPYPLLEVHTGNESAFYTTAAFNMMNYFEFISDSYVSLKYRHYFEGLFFNRIPLIKKLKWRFLTTGAIVYGGMSQRNLDLIPLTNSNGDNTRIFSSLQDKPYAEVGYGIENIFKVLRIDAFHRLSYLNRPGVRNFGVKISLQFTL
jgi:hypothetical protein